MKKFFLKKGVFFVCFLSFIMIFFLLNIFNTKMLKTITDKVQEELVNGDSIKKSGALNNSIELIVKNEALQIINFKEIYGFLHKITRKNEFGNFYYIKGKDGMMYYATLTQSKEDTLLYAKRVKNAMEEAEKKGAKTLFIMLPSKIIYGLSDIKGEFFLNDKNWIQDELLLSMKYLEVPTLDLRNAMVDSGLPIETLFYKTDNIWTTEAAFIAATAIAKEIEEVYEDDWDPLGYYSERDNYKSIIYKESMTGTLGRNAGVVYAGRDDFSILIPKFDTKMEWYDLEDNKKSEGSFEEALVTLDLEGGLYANPGNDLYLSGVSDRDRIINKYNEDGPKILCLRGSSFSPVASFLAPMCSQIDMVYARSDRNDLDYEKLILEEEYDYLIIEGDPFNISGEAFDYFKE